MMRLRSLPILMAALFLMTSVSWAAPPVQKRVLVGTIHLSYLDFGGNGPAMVMLPGLNDTGYIYKDLAPKFTDQYHVYALTRRGCGDSDKPKVDATGSNYNSATLVSDLAGFLDAMHIDKAVLVGHSLAGDELTGFAVKYPARVIKLVYLDASYDRSTGPFSVFANITPAQGAAFTATTPSALVSLTAYRAYWKKFASGAWSPASEANMRDRSVIGKTGKITEKCLPEVTAALVIGSANAHPAEDKVTAPALCFFALPVTLAQAKAKGILVTPDMLKQTQDWYDSQIAAASDKMHAQVVKMPPGTSHYLFVQYPEQVETAMHTFLAASDAASPAH